MHPRPAPFNRREFIRWSGHSMALAGSGLLATALIPATPSSGSPEPAPLSAPFLAGWATVSITPDQPVQLAGQHHERVSTGAPLYPCLVTALALEGEDGSGRRHRAILIACDLVMVGRELARNIRARVAELAPDFPVAFLSIHATHTHTAPTVIPNMYKAPDPGVMGPAEYAPFFCERAAQAAAQAWQARRPCAMNHVVGHAAVGFNRIAAYADGAAHMYGDSNHPGFIGLEGGHDHGMELVFFRDPSDTLAGVIINLACPAQVVEGQYYVSADFWGPVREEIQRLYGAQVTVLPMISAAGDQSPRDLVRRGRGEPDMRSEPGMREMARRIVHGVRQALETGQSAPDHRPIFRNCVEEIALPLRQVTEAEAEAARRERETLTAAGEAAPDSFEAAMVRQARDVIERFERQAPGDTYAMELHALRLGDVAIVTNPFELYLDYGLQIKARSRATHTLVAQLANDFGLYLPTRRAIAGGAYGSRISESLVGPEGGEALVEKTLAAIHALWE